MNEDGAEWREAEALESGRIYSVVGYDGICDACGGEVRVSWMLVMFIGRYVDVSGYEYDYFQTCFYMMCKTCRRFIDYIRWFDKRALVLFERKDDPDKLKSWDGNWTDFPGGG